MYTINHQIVHWSPLKHRNANIQLKYFHSYVMNDDHIQSVLCACTLAVTTLKRASIGCSLYVYPPICFDILTTILNSFSCQ